MNRTSMLHDSPLGRMLITAEGPGITGLHFCNGNTPPGTALRETALLRAAALQLDQYFNGERKRFDLPLDLRGTPFQLRVWRALEEIPYGQTRSYGQIARATGNEKAARAVGMANNRNPIAIIVPCHRVIGADGKLVGYGGGLDKKAYLLELERRHR